MTIALSSLVYALVTCVLFYSLRTRFRGAVLAAASVIYICLFSPAAGRAALSMAVFAYIYGLLIAFFAEHKRQKAADIAAGRAPEIRIPAETAAHRNVNWDFLLQELDLRTAQLREKLSRASSLPWEEQMDLRDSLAEIQRQIFILLSQSA